MRRARAGTAARAWACVASLCCALALACAFALHTSAQQKADADYAARIREYTTEKYFLTELVDHLPMSDRVPAPDKVLGYVSLHFDFIAARTDYPRLFQRFMMSGDRPFMRVRQKYFSPVARKFQQVIEQGIRSGELCASDSAHTAISLVALTVFYFSAAPVLEASGIIDDPYRKSQLARRKSEVLNFARRALFKNPQAGGK